MTNKKHKKYGQLLSIVLSLSALTAPVYGEDWPDLFNPDNDILKSIGQKTLSFLDEQSLGRAAQSSQKVNQFVQNVRKAENAAVYSLPGPLIRPQRALTRDILESLQAQPDLFSPLIQEIRGTSFTAILAVYLSNSKILSKVSFLTLLIHPCLFIQVFVEGFGRKEKREQPLSGTFYKKIPLSKPSP